MKIKKTPMRSCVISREKLPKNELVRVVRTPEGNVIIDETGKANGRGAYLKKDKEIFEKAKKTKVLNKMLEVEITDEVYEQLNKLI